MELTEEEAAEIEDAIEAAAVEVTEEESVTALAERPRRTSLLTHDSFAGENVRGLRPQSAAGRARALRRRSTGV